MRRICRYLSILIVSILLLSGCASGGASQNEVAFDESVQQTMTEDEQNEAVTSENLPPALLSSASGR